MLQKIQKLRSKTVTLIALNLSSFLVKFFWVSSQEIVCGGGRCMSLQQHSEAELLL